jgi:hypothetical protein
MCSASRTNQLAADCAEVAATLKNPIQLEARVAQTQVPADLDRIRKTCTKLHHSAAKKFPAGGKEQE